MLIDEFAFQRDFLFYKNIQNVPSIFAGSIFLWTADSSREENSD